MSFISTNTKPIGKADFHIALLLFDGFNALALQAFIDPFRCANYLKNTSLYQWSFLGESQKTVRASNGLEISGLIPRCDMRKDTDLLMLNASWGSDQFATPKLSRWLQNCATKNITMGGMDTGAFLLASAGLLKGRHAAVHYEHIAAFREHFPDVHVGEDIFVIDEDRVSCCGGMAASDFALEIIRRHHGDELANASARYIFHDRLRTGSEGQLPHMREPVGSSVPQVLREAISEMERHLEQTLPILNIAERVGISQRQLERLFNQYTGLSPVRYYVNVRLDRAQSLLTQTELPLLEVGIACGFSSAASFSRAYKNRFGQTPMRGRKEGRIPFQFRSFPSHAGL